MTPFAWILIGPLFLISGCLYLIILIAVARALARVARRAGLRVTLLLRGGRIPADGTPLTADEAYLFTGVQRGWKERAPEPEYQEEGEW